LRCRLGAAAISAVGVALVVLVTSACSVPAARNGAATPPPGATAAPSKPSKQPKPSPSAKPKPTPTVPKLTGSVVPVNLPPQAGIGPFGSIKSTGSASIALTFDDGPDPVYTPKMLDLLKKQGVKATFCVVGTRAARYPELVKRIVADGHTICNHTWQHRMDLGKQSKEVILTDLRDTNKAILEAAPRAKIKYFRAPGGYFSPQLVELAAALGMKSVYWSLDTRDWEFVKYDHGQPMVDHILETVQSGARRGSIILAHDFHKPDTVIAFTALVPWLKKYFKLIALPT